ncbi:DNA-binding protein [Gonapodya prolifera JEL478]|uniref:DNA-binding protein n=1 Tax=Gonapodya prolifera (strain JEL478) TaxID=1344416 RepID=A0A139AMS8_GONPJ|nr:DNA-binding protein [Gonapodya prolifera JEL478]|eukprot:KXS17755.1 DNA-binding protein [Gonapodya prolifera JEL478]
MLAGTTNKFRLTLKGSTDIVTEFFEYGLNSILYQRGLYAPEDFKSFKKYGLHLLVSTDEKVQTYLKTLLSQVERWLMASAISKLVLVIISKDTRETVERWQFDVQLEKDPKNQDASITSRGLKPEKAIHDEIQAVLRQITASVSFLPILDEPCTFNVLAYTDKNAEIPPDWKDSDNAHLLPENAQHVRLRGFGTGVHRVESLVAYRSYE